MTPEDPSRYWRGWSEQRLASFQQDQGSSNHCAKYAAASALNLLYGTDLQGKSLVDCLESRILKGTGLYTILGNHNGSLVFQAANLVRKLAVQQGLKPRVRSGFGTPEDIRGRIQDRDLVTIISLTYFQGQEPGIARGTNARSSLGPARILGGHLMILAAYDLQHQDTAGRETPWGFISSWPGKDQLYWMTEGDFRRTWGQLSHFNMVTVQAGR